MKVAFAGDWHGSGFWARQAIEYAKEQGAETIVHLGDFGYDFTRDYRQTVEAALRRTGLTLQFVDGNHENFTWLYAQPVGDDGRREISPRVHHLPRGYRWEWDGLKFLAVGGAFSVDRHHRELGESWWMEETLTDEDIYLAAAGGNVDFLISHDAPTGYIIPGIARYAHLWPSAALLQAADHRERLGLVTDVVQPRFVMHGHYHVDYCKSVDLGYGPVSVYGLNCNGSTLRANVLVVDLIADL